LFGVGPKDNKIAANEVRQNYFGTPPSAATYFGSGTKPSSGYKRSYKKKINRVYDIIKKLDLSFFTN